MNALTSSDVALHWCVAARGDGPAVHLVARTTLPPYGPIHGSPALCGAVGVTDRFGRVRWSRTKRPGKTHCAACFAIACSSTLAVRIDWT